MDSNVRTTPGSLPSRTGLPEIQVLHVEADPGDSQLFRRTLESSLTARSHALLLEQAASLEEGLERLAGNRFDLVVTNLELPDSRGSATIDALARHKADAKLTAYAGAPDIATVGDALAHGADDFYDGAIFDVRVLDQVLGRILEKALLASSLVEVIRGHETVLAHRRERDREIQRLISAMLAVTLESLPRDQAIAKVIDLLLGAGSIAEFQAGVCFLRDPVSGGCRPAVQRGIDPAAAAQLMATDLADCGCARLRGDGQARFNRPGAGPLPPCQKPCGRHAGYSVTLIDRDSEPVGSLALWTAPDTPRDEYGDRLIENAGLVVASLISHHQQIDRVRRLQQVVEQSPLSVMITDIEGRITYGNPQLYRLTGYAPEELLGQNPSVLGSGLVSAETFQEMWSMLSGGEIWEGELVNRKKDGELYWEEAIISPVLDTHGSVDGYVAVKRDITEVIRFKAQLEHQATHDSLTDLANRSLVGDRTAQSINLARRQERLVVALLIDIDDFGSLNETHGQAAGDRVLREVAGRLSARARDYDTVARLGNDEFVVVLADVPEERIVLELASDYLGVLDQPFEIDHGEVRMTASMGVATYPLDSHDGDELLRHASMALARQKSTGAHGFALFGQEMEEDLRERYELLSALRSAVDAMQLELYYQPQIDPVTGNIDGAEALLRWHLPDRGMISPMKFIPLAESSGLIVPIGTWVLETACRQVADWVRVSGAAFPISVNVSSRQFHEPDFVATVEQALASSGLDPALLVLELTESLLLLKPDEAREVMRRISALGVRLAIDDFGTGYSSLSYLSNLPIHQLKIDQAFIRDIDEDPSDAIIVSTIIGMAHNLGLEVVGEGAETENHVSFLATYRCNLIQGYHYSRPLPASEFLQLLGTLPWQVTGD